jgi:hypothetical protein
MICHILYFPFAIIITIVFTVSNLICLPIAYSVHIIRLLTSLIKQPSFFEVVLRVILIAKFAIYGLFYFPVAIVIDMFVFFGNLYTVGSVDTMNDKSKRNFSKEGLQLFEDTLNDILFDLEQEKAKMMKKKEDLKLIVSSSGGLLMDMT